MVSSSKSPLPLNRSSGGNRWSHEDDDRLLDLVRKKEDWSDIATALKRSFSSVQNRFRFLKSSQAHASTIVALISTRAEDPSLAPDLSCGALSRAARETLKLVRNDISRFQRQSREVSRPIDETDLIVGAIIREILLLRLRTDTGWLRFTVSRVRTTEHGFGREALRRAIRDLEKSGYCERLVGYPGALALVHQDARKGRLIWIRASSRLTDLCERQGIGASNLLTHFPSLKG
jgi:hypothetical protein